MTFDAALASERGDGQFYRLPATGTGSAAGFAGHRPVALSDTRMRHCTRMKKPKHEAELFKAALQAGIKYAEGRGAVEFEPTDSASDKSLYVYRLLVHDKIITPMPEEQVAEKTVRHRLALWYAHQLPKGHPLLG